MIQMQATIREHRRGHWAARGLVVTHRHGQLFERQVGPRAFASEGMAYEWIFEEAANLSIRDVRVVVEARSEPGARQQTPSEVLGWHNAASPSVPSF